jgi:hypothetical protein
MKKLEVGDVIPIYEIISSAGYQGLSGGNFIPQQRPQNIHSKFDFGLKELRNVTYYANTRNPIITRGLFEEHEIKPIGQMRIKKLK